jgi:hypothetical protein
MPYKDGKINMRGYGATTSTTKPVTKDSYKIRLARRKNIINKFRSVQTASNYGMNKSKGSKGGMR